WLDPCCATYLSAFDHPAVVHGFAFADQAQRHVCERREISGRAHRAAARNHRKHVVVQHREQCVDQFSAHTGNTRRETIGLEQQHATDDRCRERLADSDGVTAHEIELQLTHLVRGDALVRERTETGGDAVTHAIRAHCLAHDFDTALHALPRLVAQYDARSRAFDAPQSIQRKRLAVNDQWVYSHDVSVAL